MAGSTPRPTVPGAPGSAPATVEEPTEPHDPLPPKPDQTGPETVTPTGETTGLPQSAVAQQGAYLTTAQGARPSDTDHSLKAGPRGPVLLQDHHLREKITHFDHERIPERAVHARGAAAHGVFVGNGAAEKICCASLFEKGKETPVFVRFSTVLGSRGSADTVRDTRGFATKFYTDEGVFDLVGNNIPVFFIQDAIKFPDIVHAAKPHPDREIPQAQSAHDTFWDFVTLHTEATAHTLWNMSDRGIPRSYRMMEGFGVHTFRLINDGGESVLVKFHWKPKLGVHSMLWEEAQIAAGVDPDMHRRDLADAIEAGAFPQWDLGVQVFPDTEEQMFEGIDLLDPTKIVPEELAPVQVIGTMTLNANPTNYFSQTEQVAFHPGHLVRGIDVTNDPLLQGRLFSYIDTQITRLGGPNFAQLPINRPHAEINDMLRDGMHQTAVHSGVAPYRPNSLDGGCPFIAGSKEAVQIEFPEAVAGQKVRAAAATFDDHFSSARIFYASLTDIEKAHVAKAYTFELGKCYEKAIKERAVTVLREIDEQLARTVATGLGVQLPSSATTETKVVVSPALSQLGQRWPTDGRIIGIVADESTDLGELAATVATIGEQSMTPLVIAPHGGELGSGGKQVVVSRTLDTARSIEFDALLITSTVPDPRLNLLLQEAHRHLKAIAYTPGGAAAITAAGIAEDSAGVQAASALPAAFDALAALLPEHRVWARAAEYPR
ncbi:catalase [Nocardia goodfellowii]|uniref:Catalase n=1 Tax=Nocardia goodfellowii TaxID=882446 RepID=A0ABS4QLL0_9NOCA|nr:catalase [Nocardia goodfellowii]MBP2192591.1 catalase [Nocardia goodfellowii]